MTEAAKLKGEPMSLLRPRFVCNKTLDFECRNSWKLDLHGTQGLECSTSQRGLPFVDFLLGELATWKMKWVFPKIGVPPNHPYY